MTYTPYSPPSQESSYSPEQTSSQYPTGQSYPSQMASQQSAYQAPPSHVVERMQRDITEVLTPKLTAILIIVSTVIVYVGVVLTILTHEKITLFEIGKILAGLGILIFSIVPSLLSMQEKLEPRHKATYYAIPVLAIIALVLLI